MSGADGAPVTATEAKALFAGFLKFPVLVLAVSGGPDSTALLWLATRWRKGLRRGPKLIAATVDHGLRPAARDEALAVKRLARRLDAEHRILRWTGVKPKTGVQAAARQARYRLLADCARKAGGTCILTAHTLDDQAETVLFRIARGSGLSGLAGMGVVAPVPVGDGCGIVLARPLLGIPKSRLLATLKAAGLAFADDPSNRDPRFTRPRLRAVMPILADEGLTAERLAMLARRADRAERALRAMVADASGRVSAGPWPAPAGLPESLPAAFLRRPFFELPEELALRLLGQAVAAKGDEGPAELGKLETLLEAMSAAHREAGAGPRKAVRRTLAGAVVTLEGDRLSVASAPPRRSRAPKRP